MKLWSSYKTDGAPVLSFKTKQNIDDQWYRKVLAHQQSLAWEKCRPTKPFADHEAESYLAL